MSDEMLVQAREQIKRAYANAIETKVQDPVVLVMDLRDERALWMAERVTERSQIDQTVLESGKQGVTPLLTCAVARPQAGLLMGQMNPNFSNTLDRIQVPADQFLVIQVTGGRSTFSGFPQAS